MSNNLAPLNPFDIFIGLDGKPLNGGYIYVGVAGQDPELNPVQLFWDIGGTLPATQPLRTLNGYLSNGGAPARVAVNGTYSVRVRDKKKQQVYFESNVLLTSGGGVSGLSDNGGFIAQLVTNAGYVGYRILNQAAGRMAEFLGFGSANAGAYGIAPGMTGINTPAGVDFSIGVGDAVLMLFKASLNAIGIGKTPLSGKGLVQLQGSASGGLNLGNVDNTDPAVLDWYEEETTPFTPLLLVGGLVTDSSITSAAGTYTRIGNLVFFNLTIQINIKGVLTGGLSIRGMPTPAIGGATYPVMVDGFGLNLSSPGWLSARLSLVSGNAVVSLRTASATGGVSALDTILQNGCGFSVSGFYTVA